MLFNKQLYRHDPDNGVWGDCHRTAIACLLNLEPEQVPHFGRNGAPAETFHRRVDVFLRCCGLDTFAVLYPGETSLEDVLATQGHLNPRNLYMLGGTSRTGCNHTVICRGGEIIWDPSLDDSGIIGPMDDGYWWISFLVPIHQVA